MHGGASPPLDIVPSNFMIDDLRILSPRLNLVSHKDIKKRELSCCPFHASRLSHCLSKLNRQRQSPRRYDNPYHGKETPRIDIITPWASTVATFKTLIMWKSLREFRHVSNTASDKRQLICLSSSYSHPMSASCSIIRFRMNSNQLGAGCLTLYSKDLCLKERREF